MQTAESDELYITFDEILSQTLEERENQFPKIIGNWHMELLLDLLVLPEGPSIRDKVSHGEIDSNDLHSKKSIQIVAVSYLAINTILGSLEKSSALVENDPTHSIAVNNYSSQYHPTSLLLKDIHIAVISVKSVLLKHLHSGTTLNEFRLKDAECLAMFMKDHSFMMRMEPLLGTLIEFGEGLTNNLIFYRNRYISCCKIDHQILRTFIISEKIYQCYCDPTGAQLNYLDKQLC